MKTRLLTLVATLFLLLLPLHAEAACVILLHGLMRTDNSMQQLEQQLLHENFTTVNMKYPSRKHTIPVLADMAIEPALEQCRPEEEINFVTHSLGGILVRQYLSLHTISGLNHVVMLGPPNQGSEVVDKLGNFPGFRFITGAAGMQLGTGVLSIPNQLGMANFDVGIIAGNRSVNWILSSIIPSDDDGKVSIESTMLDGMNDHIEMPVTHPFMMRNKKVIAQVIHYLQHGRFKRQEQHDETAG